MRGKRKGRACLIISIRITPASAGKTGFALKNIFADWDHPRRCGENSSASAFRFCGLGSPPQVRGKLIDCVGVTGSRQDHPRRCGENFMMPSFCASADGSPPQVRGKRMGSITFNIESEDHPRRCGENCGTCWCRSLHTGSPPQVRGKQEYTGVFFERYRITPAGAGKTRGCNRQFRRGGDHPRRCGENDVRECRTKLNMGSPPRMRGKLTVLL